ncbi:ArsR/SmtB family transcription factor [Mesorhizobium sp. IMUNJ 23232]|uniref:ArsR/SmtB family transcription factor n=1 Tax=Mesorhizobium sp. IMUNJ 23232 TaxID=3376064 RepID=UPI0037A5B3CA
MDLPLKNNRNFLTINATDGLEVLKGLSSPVRINILKLLHARGALNVNEISEALSLPQSTVATNIQVLESCDLIRTETVKASKGQQKLCAARFDEIVLRFDDYDVKTRTNVIELSMPLGLYTNCAVSPPCGLCSSESVIGLLDVPDYFLDPDRMKAGLIWFERGHVEYKFPNNAKILKAEIEALEFSMELSSEVPGTNANWPSDVSIWVNDVLVGTWTSPGDFGDKRGIYTPRWWKLEGSQYGHLKTWKITGSGTFLDGAKTSDVTLEQLHLAEHHSIRLRVGIDEHAEHPGGLNIFGKGFGNHDQDIILRLHLKPDPERGRTPA